MGTASIGPLPKRWTDALDPPDRAGVHGSINELARHFYRDLAPFRELDGFIHR
jgi:hypothetical protein